MMLRPARSGPHSGQVSFPGGAHEAQDADLRETALRESEEELGIRPADVQILGALSNIYVRPSRYLVTPYVGWSDRRPDFVPEPGEVAGILEIPFAHLNNAQNRRSEERELGGQKIMVPYFSYYDEIAQHEYKIWGASAMMLGELLATLNS